MRGKGDGMWCFPRFPAADPSFSACVCMTAISQVSVCSSFLLISTSHRKDLDSDFKKVTISSS